ncbi:pre-mRNA-processing factor 39-like, partial [Myiozetetes cayanensis]|uniref:pre-mRNA-processing factor 39-like n=1 Tax=Myiozetetes cayanensis TaxID=478635 RepID=UPI00215E7B78
MARLYGPGGAPGSRSVPPIVARLYGAAPRAAGPPACQAALPAPPAALPAAPGRHFREPRAAMAAEGPEEGPGGPGGRGRQRQRGLLLGPRPRGAPPGAPGPVPPAPEFERLWGAAQANPHDFGAWTDLLGYVEQENLLSGARRAFDAFFGHYPYCYGYWKKFADMERRLGSTRTAEEVLERGLQSIPLSMDLWIHSISFLQSIPLSMDLWIHSLLFLQVLERGLQSIPLSMDLWIHSISFLQSIPLSMDLWIHSIPFSQVLERGLQSIPLSMDLWIHSISFLQSIPLSMDLWIHSLSFLQSIPLSMDLWIHSISFLQSIPLSMDLWIHSISFLQSIPLSMDLWIHSIPFSQVLERGLQSIPLSMDLWIHYISFLQSTLDMAQPESVQKVRGAFEAAVAAAGMDFRSDKLWELYVEWERERGELRAVTAIYDRLLSMPTQLYSHHWDRFKEHVLHNPPRAILSPEELLWVQSKLATEPPPKPPEPEGTEGPREEPQHGRQRGLGGSGKSPFPPFRGVLGVPLVSGGSLPVSPPPPSPSLPLQEELDQEKIRELVISMRQQIHAQNEAEVGKRWNFEDGIKRPYFHVKPLERAQLRNWREYLDFEVASGNHERTIVLFERCVIACALYEEFWIKYTRYLESRTVPGARSVFQRACGFHLPRKPNIHLLWAAFEEKQGNVEEARRILQGFELAVPGLAMVRLRRVSLERPEPPRDPNNPFFPP